ncbi:MAG: DHH family phosphoesterase [Candidatus Promineifilaceae bacterium]
MLDSSIIESIGQALEKAEKILVITHIAPDGDAIGSLTATGVALKQISKDYSLVCDDGLPGRFKYLALADEVETEPDRSIAYDLIISLDCGDTDRMGKAYAGLPDPVPPVINIDHHITNTNYGKINVVSAKANSTTEILYELLPELGAELTTDLSTCLLTGLLTDTLGFRTANVTSQTLRVASALLDTGLNLFSIMTRAMDLKDIATLLIWQKGLSNMSLEEGVLWTTISNQERMEAGHNGTSSFGLGNMMANVYQARMSAVIMELEDGRVSVGFRSRPPYSVSELATGLGGGGHHQASGCTIDGPLEQAEALVVSKSKQAIRMQRTELNANND